MVVLVLSVLAMAPCYVKVSIVFISTLFILMHLLYDVFCLIIHLSQIELSDTCSMFSYYKVACKIYVLKIKSLRFKHIHI